MHMLSKMRKQLTLKRLLIVLGALFLSISIGSGVKSAFAGQGIQSLLTSWFEDKKTESINQIDKAITEEKDLLMVELKKELQAEMKQVDEELTQYTNKEIEQRINGLRKYADELLTNRQTEHNEANKEVSASLNAIYEQAVKQMNEVSPSSQVPTESEQNPNEESNEPDDAIDVGE